MVEPPKILPDEILWRKKEAFSDGVSSQGRSLYMILQEKIGKNLENVITPFTEGIQTEKYYYKQQFDTFFPNCTSIVPYFWMPKYTNATDPSARTLTFYEKKESLK
jgi:asparagine synthase (glutamine-hydrolysing)